MFALFGFLVDTYTANVCTRPTSTNKNLFLSFFHHSPTTLALLPMIAPCDTPHKNRNGLYGQWVKHVDLDFSDGAMTSDQFQEALVINSLGGCLIALLFVVPILLLHPRFRTRPTSQVLTVTTHHHSNNHHQDRYA